LPDQFLLLALKEHTSLFPENTGLMIYSRGLLIVVLISM
jgi:hypothetical protein